MRILEVGVERQKEVADKIETLILTKDMTIITIIQILNHIMLMTRVIITITLMDIMINTINLITIITIVLATKKENIETTTMQIHMRNQIHKR